MAVQCHPRSLISVPIAILVLSCSVSEILQVLYTPLFHPNFGVFPLDYTANIRGSEEQRTYADYSCNYFQTNPTYTTRYINVMERQTDREKDDLRWQYCALHCVHRAVKIHNYDYIFKWDV